MTIDINASYFESTELEYVLRARLKEYNAYSPELEEQISDVAADAGDLRPAQTGRAVIGPMTVIVFNHDGKTRSPFELVTYVL